MQVVLAGPLHAQVATGERLGQDRRFQHEVGLGLAAETAAEQVTLTVTLSNGSFRRSAMRSRVTCGAWVGAQTSQAPSLYQAVDTGGSIGAWARCGR